MHYERLSANDTAFLRIETPDEPQHVGSLAIFEGPPLRDLTGRVRICLLYTSDAADDLA